MNIGERTKESATNPPDSDDTSTPGTAAAADEAAEPAQLGWPDSVVRYHVVPTTGEPEECLTGPDCEFGGEDFHYPNTHDAAVAWRARQLERGIVAYRNVMRAQEQAEEQDALDKLAGNAKRTSRKMSVSVVRSIVMKNASKYLVNFLGIFIAWAVASGKWLTDDWVRRLLPAVATVVLVALVTWFAMKAFKGTRRAAGAVKNHRSSR